MSREQRRANRKQQARTTGGAPPPPSRRTPVKAPGSGVPWNLIGIAGGALAIVLLIVYLVLQQGDGGQSKSEAERAAADADPTKPGVYISPQGAGHFREPQSLARLQTPFCEGVARSETADVKNRTAAGATGTGTPRATTTPSPTRTANATSASSGTPSAGTPTATPTVRADCFLSNPPTSGQHLGSQRSAEVAPGVFVEIPPQNLVLPDDVELPRDAIPHVLEHAGVFIGWHCGEGDQACLDVVQQLRDLTEDRIENHDNRVVMGIDSDLPLGEIGIASWTRVLNVKASEIDMDEVRRFISTHSCRYDPEGFC